MANGAQMLRLRLHKFQLAIAFAQISNGNCVCENFKWQLRLRNLRWQLAIDISNRW